MHSPTLAGRRYGWHPSLHDPRDLVAEFPTEITEFPEVFSLRGEMPDIYDQGQLGSCTANSVAACVEHHFAQAGIHLMPSRLWIYYFERFFEHTLGQGDTGAYGRDGFKVAKKMGVPPEGDMPYVIARFEDAPPLQAERDAVQFRIPGYKAVRRTAHDLRASLLTNRRPIAFGFSVPQSFESVGADGIWGPQPGEPIIGGHEVTLIGFKVINGKLYAEVRNSWGPDWGDAGHVWMPMDFLTSASCSDFRAIHII